MPISQDRLITLVAHADTLLDAFDKLKQFTKALDIAETITIGNSAIVHSEDPNTKQSIGQLLSTINNLVDYFTNIDIPQKLRDDIAEERIHFKKHRRANEYLANYKRIKQQTRINNETSRKLIPQFFIDEEQLPMSQTVPANPPPMSEPKKRKTLAEYQAERRAKGIPDDEFTPTPSPTQTTSNAEDNSELRPTTSIPGVLRNSVPSDEELYKQPIKPGENVL